MAVVTLKLHSDINNTSLGCRTRIWVHNTFSYKETELLLWTTAAFWKLNSSLQDATNITQHSLHTHCFLILEIKMCQVLFIQVTLC